MTGKGTAFNYVSDCIYDQLSAYGQRRISEKAKATSVNFSDKHKYQIDSLAVGSTQKTISLKNIKAIKIPVCNESEQKAIAATLSCLDDKIELNNRINKTLEEMAQAIFKSWFVDFEPFQDGEFEDSELGRIPKGWRVEALEEHVESIDNRGKTPPLSSQITPFPIIDVKALSGASRIN